MLRSSYKRHTVPLNFQAPLKTHQNTNYWNHLGQTLRQDFIQRPASIHTTAMTPQTAIFVLQLALAIWGAFAAPADSQHSSDKNNGFYGNGTYKFGNILKQMQSMADLTNRGIKSIESTCLPTPEYGGLGGSEFQGVCSAQILTVCIGVTTYDLGTVIETIQVEYKLDNGTRQWGKQHGKGAFTDEFYFADGEKIIAVVGRADNLRLRQLAFLTEDSNGWREVKGPVGSETTGHMFIVNRNIYGIYGRSGDDIDALGFLYRLNDV